MQKYLGNVIDYATGIPAGGVVVTVYEEDDVTLASLFEDDETTPKDNPFTVGSGADIGEFEFKAANGRYNIYFAGTGVTPDEALDILLFDPDDLFTLDASPADNELMAWDTAAGRFINQTPTEAGLDARYARMDARTDGWVWVRRTSTGTDAAVGITQQSTGRILNLYAGAGDGSVVSYFDASGYLVLPGDPTSALMAATKQYVDLLAAGMDPKASVRVASTANINLSSPGATIDAVSMSAGDRFLAKDQSTGSQNGIYVWNGAASAATRATDANTSAEVTSGMFCFVTEGATHGNTGWLLTTDDPITLDTTALSFTQFSTVGAYTDEQAQDAVGTILTDSAEIDWTYNDGAPSITASLIANSVGVGKLTSSAGSRLFGRATGSAGAGEEVTLGTGLGFSGGALNLTGGKETIWVPASAIKPRTTTGCAALAWVESGTNKVMIPVLDFDMDTIEYAQFVVGMPKSWNEGTVTFKATWLCGVTGNVIWGLQGVAISDDDAYDAAFGTAQEVTDGVTATTDKMVSAESSAITIAGSPAAEDDVFFQVYRKASDGADTAEGDARLVGIRLFYTSDTLSDI